MGSHLDLTPAQLAFGLRDLRAMNQAHGTTAGASMLSEAVSILAYRSGNAAFIQANSAFHSAQYRYRCSDLDPAKWETMLAAAEHLATFLDQLGPTSNQER